MTRFQSGALCPQQGGHSGCNRPGGLGEVLSTQRSAPAAGRSIPTARARSALPNSQHLRSPINCQHLTTLRSRSRPFRLMPPNRSSYSNRSAHGWPSGFRRHLAVRPNRNRLTESAGWDDKVVIAATVNGLPVLIKAFASRSTGRARQLRRMVHLAVGDPRHEPSASWAGLTVWSRTMQSPTVMMQSQ